MVSAEGAPAAKAQEGPRGWPRGARLGRRPALSGVARSGEPTLSPSKSGLFLVEILPRSVGTAASSQILPERNVSG